MFKNIAHKQRGVTLIEFIVAFAILSVLLTAVVTFSRSTITMNRSMVREANGVNQLKNAFNYVSRDTQMAGMVAPTDPTNLNSNHFPLTLGWITYPTDLTTVVYSLDSNGTLVRTESLNGVLRSTMTIATNVNLDPAQTNCVWDNINNKLTINIAISIGTTTEVRQFVLTPRVIQSSSQTANTISGSSTPNPAGYGDTITLTANVTPTAGSDVISSGTVTFFDGGNAIGASPLINGTASYQPISPLLSGIHTFKAVFSGDALYSSSTSSNWTQTVNKAALTITANSSSKNYGATVTFAGTEFTATGLVNGDTVTSVTLTSDGVTATATVSSSPYSIVPSVAVGTGLNNYTISYVNGSLTVNPKALTVTANSSSKTYGQTVTFLGTEFTTSALLNGDTVTSVTLTSSGASAGAAVGSYNIVPSAALGSGVNNYTISYVNGTLTVNKVALTLTITATGPSKVYGTALTAGTSTTNFTASGTITGETVTSVTLTPNAAGLSATTSVGAAYIITPSLATGTGGFLASNYNITYTAYNGTVTKAPLTVTATGPSKTYGTALTTGTSATNFTATGMVNGETVTSVTLTPDAAGLSATTATGAAYIVTPSSATGTGGFLASNYNITYVPFSGTVTAKALTVTATGPSKVYGIALTTGTSTTNFTASGTITGETVTSVTLTPNAAGLSATTAAGAAYIVTPSLATGTGGFLASNYNITYVPFSGTVTAKALTITATGPSKVYGTALSAGTSTTNFTASGTITGETVTSVTLTPNAAGLSATTAVGAAYIITPSLATGTGGFLASNYNITYVPFSGTVTAKALTVTATGPSKVYGTALTTGTSATNFTASGTITGETVTSVTLNPDAAGLSATTTAGAAYIITPSLATGTGGFLASNYNITYVPFSGTVSTKALTITANSTSKTYGATVTFAGTEFTTVGLVNGNTVTSVTLTSSGAVATAVVSGSPYAITPSAAVGTGLSNYTISYVNGTLTVNKATLTITANNRSKIYGQTLTFTGTEFTTAGLVNGNTVTSVTLTSSGAVATAVVSGSPYNIVPSAAVGTGLTNYNISYVNGSLTVTKAASSTSLTASVSGITVTFTATVTPGTATGTVTFYDGATALGTSTVTGGVATYSTSTLSVASHSITAVYNGDGNCLTSTSSAQKLAIFIPSADSYIRQNTATTNYGTNTSLNVTYSTTADYNTLVQFNVTSLASSNIDKAYLSLYQTTAFSASVTEYNVSRSWNESQVTWNKATTTPSVNWTTAGGDITGAANSITIVSNSWNNWTVTSDVAAFITGNNYGWLLTTASTSQISFSSKEGANDPELIVLYH